VLTVSPHTSMGFDSAPLVGALILSLLYLTFT
jgi:hypothetical protein